MSDSTEGRESETGTPPAGGVSSRPGGTDEALPQANTGSDLTAETHAHHPTSPTSDGDPLRSEGLPFFIRFLVFYLLADVVLRVASVVSMISAEELAAKREIAWNSVLAVFHLVLVPQLLSRSAAARISLSAVFAIQIARFVIRFAFDDPSAWWGADELQRVQWIGQIVFYGIAIAFLNSGLGSRTLRR